MALEEEEEAAAEEEEAAALEEETEAETELAALESLELMLERALDPPLLDFKLETAELTAEETEAAALITVLALEPVRVLEPITTVPELPEMEITLSAATEAAAMAKTATVENCMVD